jgi:hypothetical protein
MTPSGQSWLIKTDVVEITREKVLTRYIYSNKLVHKHYI